MWSQFPAWFIFAAALLGCGCVATVLFLVRDAEHRLRGLGEQNDLNLAVHDQAFGQLEGRVEDMAGRLFNAATERRDATRSNHRLAADLETTANELRTARSRLTAQEGDLARVREQHRETSERLQQQRGELEEKLRLLAEVQGDLAGKARQLEALDRQRSELEQRAQRQSESQGEFSARVAELEATLAARDRALQESAAEARVAAQTRQELAARVEQQAEELIALHRRAVESEATSAARTGELQRELSQREQESREHQSTIESLERAVSDRDQRVEGLESRCRELEDHSRSRSAGVDALMAELESARREAIAAREHTEALERDLASHKSDALERESQSRESERDASARLRELEADLARREAAWHERSASFEGLQREIASKERELGAARVRCEELERQGDRDQARVRESLEAQGAVSRRTSELEAEMSRREDEARLRVNELEAALASRAEEIRERSTLVMRLEADLASRSREVETVEERCRELVMEMRHLQEEEVERRRREIEIGSSHEGRVRELEATILEREGELAALRTEQGLLETRVAALARELEAGHEELRDREQRRVEAEERLEASRREIERCQQASEIERAPIDPLVEGRILPLFRRGAGPGAELLPDGYLEGLEQGDLELALRNLLGGVEPLSASSMATLADRWRKERTAWKQAPFQQQAVYLWADGTYVKAGLAEESQALLVVFAAFVDGTRSIVAVETGKREAKEDWLSILQGLERRGLGIPRLVVADETLGIFDALDQLGWNCARQRCWSRRMDEVVALLPKNSQGWAAEKLRRLTNAESRAEAKEIRDQFAKRCGVRQAAAAERLAADWRQMTSFYGFPKSHWPHLRTTSVVESTLSAIRLRSGVARACPTTPDAEAMLWKLLVVGEHTFRKLNSPLLLPAVARGDAFVDGEPDERTRVNAA